MKTPRFTPASVALLLFAFVFARAATALAADASDRTAALRGSFGTYAGQPRGSDGRVDVEKLAAQLVDLRANTYHWLIWTAPTDWEDLQRFLPIARRHNILVWACLVPPSESPPRTQRYSEPFRLDYERWALEFAKLAATEPNLAAWSIDDFSHNLGVFTPERLERILGAARAVNPRLAFVPCWYFPGAAKPDVAAKYRLLLDGILFPYRHESDRANLTDASLVATEVARLKAAWGAKFPIIVDVYSTAHSRLGASTPDYVRQVMTAGIRCADGVHIYTHPAPGSEKHAVVRRLFHDWAADPSLRKPSLTASPSMPPSVVPSLTLRRAERPAWLRNEGIVMAGSWEPLLFRVRRDGGTGYTPTPEQRAGYEREHSPEMIAKLKSIGVNFVMMHCYKGGGLVAERESMADAVKFARLCHEAGLHVGCYTYSGAFIWELFFPEMPDARDWVVREADGNPLTYGKAQYRYFWNRNHPAAEEFYRGIVRFAIEDLHTDLVHLDNHTIGPGFDANSIARCRDYLRSRFSAEFLRANGVDDVANALPPRDRSLTSFIGRAWADFCNRSVADSFHAMTRYARTLRPDILMETNPAGVDRSVRWAVDHGRLLRGGEAFWDEGRHPGFVSGALVTRIRTYKAARGLDNMAFAYVTNPLEAAEAMAFNLDCLGAIGWFEYGEIVARPGVNEPMSAALGPFVDFYHRRHDLLRDARIVSDVGVFRSHPSLQFGPPALAKLTGEVEDLLIANRCAFQLVFDQQVDELARWPVLVLAGCVALSDAQVNRLREYVAGGGRLCVIGPLATHDEWMLPRPKPALDDLPAERVVRIDEKANRLESIRRACGGAFSLTVGDDSTTAGLNGLCSELTDQPNRRLIHLVNYRTERALNNVTVRVALPKGRSARSVILASPERSEDLTIPFREAGGAATFTVPSVGVYELAIVNW